MTEVRIQLVTPGWHTKDNIYAKGSAYHQGKLLGAVDLCAAAENISTEKEFRSFLNKLNGFFSIIIQRNGIVFASVDRIRSVPLFYAIKNGILYLGDTAKAIQQKVGLREANELIRMEFLLAGYVTGSDTLTPGLHQLQSGEYLAFENVDEWKKARYFRFSHEFHSAKRKADLWGKLDEIYIAAVERLAHWASGRTIVIPLSGGYDSRLLAALLKQIGYKSILAYTYGRSDCAEVGIAREVAKSLGLECKFVEYTNEAWWRWYHSSERQEYFRAAHNLVSIPHIQDWPAVWTLKEDNLIPPDAVIVPGHTGDFIAGRHIPKKFIESSKIESDDFISQILEQHYGLWSRAQFASEFLDALKERVKTISGCNILEFDSYEYASSKYEEWEYQERQAKFIVNSVRVYDYWGYDWWLPYYDSEVISFWLNVPYEWRIDCRLYREYVVDKYARTANISRRNASRRAPRLREDWSTAATAAYLAARYLYRLVTTNKGRRLMRTDFSYDGHPLAIFGIMDRKTFCKFRTEFRNYHSFISKAVLEGDYF